MFCSYMRDYNHSGKFHVKGVRGVQKSKGIMKPSVDRAFREGVGGSLISTK